MIILKNVPGALAGVALVVGKEGLNLVGSESANIRGTETSVWGFFAESDDAKMDVRKVKKLIGSSPNVLKVELSEGLDGVVVDRYHYPLSFNTGDQAMVLRRQDLVDMFTRIKKIIGLGASLSSMSWGWPRGKATPRS